jgi:hypothetical protein
MLKLSIRTRAALATRRQIKKAAVLFMQNEDAAGLSPVILSGLPEVQVRSDVIWYLPSGTYSVPPPGFYLHT